MTTTTTASMALEPLLLLLLLMFACCRRYFRITVELSFLAPPPGKDDPPPNLLLPTKPLSDKTSLPPPLRHLLSLLSGDRNTITTALGSSIWLLNRCKGGLKVTQSDQPSSSVTTSDEVMRSSGIALSRDWRYQSSHPPEQVIGTVSEKSRVKILLQRSQ
ncbi:hypothetical protein OROGR_012112 [Orobanche gracilis]